MCVCVSVFSDAFNDHRECSIIAYENSRHGRRRRLGRTLFFIEGARAGVETGSTDSTNNTLMAIYYAAKHAARKLKNREI